MQKLSAIVGADNFQWPKIPGDPHKGVGGNYMPLMEAVSRHTGFPPGHLAHEMPQLANYVNVQGQAFNYPGLSGPQLNEYAAKNGLALKVCEACDYYYAQLGWPKEQVAQLLRGAGL